MCLHPAVLPRRLWLGSVAGKARPPLLQPPRAPATLWWRRKPTLLPLLASPPGDATMSHAPQASGGKDPWPPCPLGVMSCGAQERVGAAKTCGAPMQAVSREDASRWCSSPRCLALWFAKVITEIYHLVWESALLPLPSGLESGALYTR